MILMLVAAFLLGMFFKEMMGSVCSTVEGNGGGSRTPADCINDTSNLIANMQGTDGGCSDECIHVWQNAHSQFTAGGACGSVKEDLRTMVDPLFNTNGKCAGCDRSNWQ